VVREMSDFERLSQLLMPIAQKFNTKIWVCEKIGRRLSCIARAGEETYSESYQIYEDERYVVFAEKEIRNEQEIDEIKNFIEILGSKTPHFNAGI